MSLLEAHLHKLNPLDRGEERELIRRFQQEGDEAARNKLVMRHLPLLNRLVKKFHSQDEEQEKEFVSEGVLGLMNAVAKFDLTYDVRFSTYAIHHIKEKMRHVFYTHSVLSIPIRVEASRRRVMTIVQQAEGQLQGTPSVSEISSITGLDMSTIKAVLATRELKVLSGDASFDRGDSSEDQSIFDTYADRQIQNPETALECKQELESAYKKAQETLQHLACSERNIQIIKTRLGLNDSRQPHKLQEVSDIYGVTRERVRQIVDKAFRAIKNPKYRTTEKGFRSLIESIKDLEVLTGTTVDFNFSN